MKRFPKHFQALAFAFLVFAAVLSSFAAPGTIDSSFNCIITGSQVKATATLADQTVLIGGTFSAINGSARTNLARIATDGSLAGQCATPEGTVETILIGSGSSIFIGGSFQGVDGLARNRIARLNGDGSLDASFVPPSTNIAGTVYALVQQADGKLLVGTTGTSNHVFRLNTDGSLDDSFTPFKAPGGGGVYALALRENGQVLVGGVGIETVYCLNSDGTVNTSFGPQIKLAPAITSPPVWVRRIVIDDAKRILIAGTFEYVDGFPRNGIARLTEQGTVDISFNPGSGADAGALKNILLQPDGRMVIGGTFTTFDGRNFREVARLNQDGGLDVTFDVGTAFSSVSVYGLCLQNEKIVVGCGTTISNRVLRRLSGGNISQTAPTIVRQPATNSVVEGTNVLLSVLANGFPLNYQWRFNGTNILGATNSQIYLARALGHHSGTYTVIVSNALGTVTSSPANLQVVTYTQGSLYYSTNYARVIDSVGNAGLIYSTALAPDGKVVVGGYFSYVNGTGFGMSRKGIAKVSPDGALDSSFNAVNGVAKDVTSSGLAYVKAVAVQPDGKILIGGSFDYVESYPRHDMARYNTNGSLDTTFTAPGVASEFMKLAVQPDGKILVGGYVYAAGGYGLVRLTSSGTIDSNFNAHLPAPSWVRAIAISHDKIIIGGSFTNNQGTVPRQFVARLNMDGTIDEQFGAQGSSPNGIVQAMVVQPDDRIVIGGSFTTIGGITRKYIARLNADGTLDTTFDPGTGPNTGISELALQLDGKILATGGFSSVAGVNAANIARFLTNGTLDQTFNGASGTAGGEVLVETNGNIIVSHSDKIYRLHGDVSGIRPPAALNNPTMTNGALLCDFTGEFGRPYRLERSTNFISWTLVTNFLSSYTGAKLVCPTNTAKSFFRVVGN